MKCWILIDVWAHHLSPKPFLVKKIKMKDRGLNNDFVSFDVS